MGLYIKKLRLDKGLSQKYLAKLLGVTPGTSINWERERVRPRKRSVERLKQVLNWEEVSLFCDERQKMRDGIRATRNSQNLFKYASQVDIN
ncbi:helix-turn-helix transcriptional regulator [candidate division KSB1 bacterium]|nr:helix-turn-helix transcriptional regulator [candidate division KSB1 bacterium]NIR68695.1 helix-turn-helix transcriptional regulator [candidate division KSB1 bacterium]NIS25512.1 helix-turn-helix transcriptional regulator [candidate division KSB1 bacterium]NIT72405.1 helix-turn-helix transcriptional regulator [candidate division KSB1 bacterium]NIU26189.1 helix-turn-helix transcriptional regulator [candidate division KSB1 bacterium]